MFKLQWRKLPVSANKFTIVLIAFAVLPVCASNETTSTTASTPARPFVVKEVGKGPPMLLIPGLMCDGTVWDQTVDHYKDRFQLHVFSLAGFGDIPPVNGPFILTWRDALLEYIRDKKLQKPIVVGHSLGGHLALAMAIEAPLEVGPIVVVDGAPAVGILMTPGVSAETISRQSAHMTSIMAVMPKSAFAAQCSAMLKHLVQDPGMASTLAQTAAKSDVQTVANAMHEVMTADLRKATAAIRSPVLLIGAAEFAKDDSQKSAVRARYEEQVRRIPEHKTVMVFDARHFIMLDKPASFYKYMDEFLGEVQ